MVVAWADHRLAQVYYHYHSNHTKPQSTLIFVYQPSVLHFRPLTLQPYGLWLLKVLYSFFFIFFFL
jgi:hypothetical protein